MADEVEVSASPISGDGDQRCVHPHREDYHETVANLRREGYWLCSDLLGVDYLGYAAPRRLPEGVEAQRFEVVVNLLDPTQRRRIRVRVQVPEDEPVVATITDLHPGMTNPEREALDMFGIVFSGHPDPSRILMPDEWEGHPLRKDYDMGRIPVQFSSPSSAR
jgi:NADH-quinone oxidoreductase subunit C